MIRIELANSDRYLALDIFFFSPPYRLRLRAYTKKVLKKNAKRLNNLLAGTDPTSGKTIHGRLAEAEPVRVE